MWRVVSAASSEKRVGNGSRELSWVRTGVRRPITVF